MERESTNKPRIGNLLISLFFVMPFTRNERVGKHQLV